MDTATKIKYYGDDPDVDQAVERLIDRDVLSPQTVLIDELLKSGSIEGLRFEEIENLYPDPENMSLEECEEYCNDYGIPCDGLTDINEWREAVRDGAEPQEIYEWYLVSPWLARQLRTLNEPILQLYEGHGAIWWGRTCTGQGIALDPTFYQIYAKNK